MGMRRYFQCHTCEGEPEFDGAGKLLYHLQEVHKIVGQPGQNSPQGNKRMLMALDGAGFARNTYEWTFKSPAGPVSVYELELSGLHIHPDEPDTEPAAEAAAPEPLKPKRKKRR